MARATLQRGFDGPLLVLYQFRGPCHDHRQLAIESKAWATREVPATNDVRTLIANQLGVDVKRVTEEAQITADLEADWLDRLELMIVIEDQFADLVVTDEEC